MMHEPSDYKVEPGPLKLLDTRVMHGANYFSAGPVAIFRIALGEYDEVFSNELDNFASRLEQTVPSLQQHTCSVGEPGGFLLRVAEGTLLGHITEHVAIELQTLAGMDVAYGKTRLTSDPGVYNVVFRFFDEMAGIYAGRAALNLVNSLLLGRSFDITPVITRLLEIREERLLGPSTQALVDEATSRGIPFLRLDAYNLVQLGTGRYQRRIRAAITSETSSIAVENVDNKRLTNRMLADQGVPVAESFGITTCDEAVNLQSALGVPLVIKPVKGHFGHGITIGAIKPKEIHKAMNWARCKPWGKRDDPVLVQPKVEGDTYRFLVVGFKVVSAARLDPAKLVGDGIRTINELTTALNQDPRRGFGDKDLLSCIRPDVITEKILSDRSLAADSVLPKGQEVKLQLSGNLRLGGSAEDVSDQIDPTLEFFVERAARIVNLNVAGIDVITTDISKPLAETGGVIIGVNATPDLRPHLRPLSGLPRNVAKPIIDLLFPIGAESRVPLFSVTGTVGKTTTVSLLAHCLKSAGATPGVTTTEGLTVGGIQLMRGDMTYPEHVALVLRDPTIDSAVLETSREGILRCGLGYEKADVGIVLNMHDDHVGADDIKRLDDLAYAKSVVAEQVFDDGVVVLNAENDLVMEMADRVWAELILFSRRRSNPEIKAHLKKGGKAVVIEGRHLACFEGRSRNDIIHLEDIPLLHQGRALCNLDAVLATVGALWGRSHPVNEIRRGISTFTPTPDHLPGRLNLIRTDKTRVLVDYAHNRAGFDGLGQFLEHFSLRKIGVFDAPGDRSDEEIRDLARAAAEFFDEIMIYEDPDRRGRRSGEILDLLRDALHEAEFPDDAVDTFEEMEEAWRHGLERGDKQCIVVILTERSEAAIQVVLGG